MPDIIFPILITFICVIGVGSVGIDMVLEARKTAREGEAVRDALNREVRGKGETDG